MTARNVIVVASQTATSRELLEALRERAAQAPTRFTLIVPDAPHDDGQLPPAQRLAEAVEHLTEHGLEVRGVLGDPNPVTAVREVWDAAGYDEIVVSTFPLAQSRWLPAGLPQRVADATGGPVAHVVARTEAHAAL